MKLISIDAWGTHDTFVIEKSNVVYCVEINNYYDNKDEVREMYRERKIRKDSKLHNALVAFAESQRKLTPA